MMTRFGPWYRMLLRSLVSTVIVSGMFAYDNACANFSFGQDASFFAGDTSAQFKLGNSNSMTGWSQNVANWSQQVFASSVEPVELSLWALVAQDGDVISQEQDLGHVNPTRFYIPEDRQIHITQDTLIDGGGRTFELEREACIIVDHGVTLTLRNMRIKNTRNNLANPIIRPTGHGAQVAFQNVECALASDFIFRDGQMFIHDDVVISGTHIFSYRSTRESYICDGATLGFENGSTFFYYPSSQDNHLIQMASDTSSIYLDGAMLLTTHTGMRLSRGTLCLDNSVTLSGYARTKLVMDFDNPIFEVEFGGPNVPAVSWSPDGRYLAIGAQKSAVNEIRIYAFDGTKFATNPISPTEINGSVQSIKWSPDGKYLVVGIYDTKKIEIYSFDGVTLSLVDDMGGLDFVFSVGWHPSGKFIAVGTGGLSDKIFVYGFDGENISPSSVASELMGSDVQALAWSPDGRFLAVGTNNNTSGLPSGAAGKELFVYEFDAQVQTLTLLTGACDDIGVIVFYLAWSPDGNFLAVSTANNTTGNPSGAAGSEFIVYDFNDLTKTLAVNASSGAALTTDAVSWSPNGKYVATGDTSIRIYRFDNGSVLSEDNFSVASRIRDLSWHPDGQYLSVVANNNTNSELRIYKANYSFDMTLHGLNNGIIFGDSSQLDGSGNLDVQVLGGASVDIVGLVVDDSV